MFEQRRKYKTCIFCYSTVLSEEHIFGDALARNFPVRSNWSVGLAPHHSEMLRKPQFTGGRPILAIAPELACIPCNTGPSSVAINEALQPLLFMIRGGRRQITALEVQRLRRYWVRVAAIVDVCTSDRDITEETRHDIESKISEEHRIKPPVLTQEDREHWLAGQDLPQVGVYLGHHSGVLGLNPLMRVVPSLVMQRGVGASLAKRIIMVIGSLAVLLTLGNCRLPHVSPGLVKMPPEVGGDLKWPPQDRVSYDDVFSLLYQDPETLLLRSVLSNRKDRRRIERHSRSLGKLDVPPDMVSAAAAMAAFRDAMTGRWALC